MTVACLTLLEFSDESWTWHSLVAAADEVTAETARKVGEEATYTPKAADSERFLKAMVSYTDRHNMKNLDLRCDEGSSGCGD